MFLLLIREQNLPGCALDPFLFVSPFFLAEFPRAMSPTPLAGSRMGRLNKEHRGKSDLLQEKERGKEGGWIQLRPPSNVREFDTAVGVSSSQGIIRGVLASKEQAAMISHCLGVPMGSMASTHGDGFQRAASGPWAIKFPELRGLWGPCLWPVMSEVLATSSLPGQLLKLILQIWTSYPQRSCPKPWDRPGFPAVVTYNCTVSPSALRDSLNALWGGWGLCLNCYQPNPQYLTVLVPGRQCLLSEWLTIHWCRWDSSNCVTILVSEICFFWNAYCSRSKLHLYGVFSFSGWVFRAVEESPWGKYFGLEQCSCATGLFSLTVPGNPVWSKRDWEKGIQWKRRLQSCFDH